MKNILPMRNTKSVPGCHAKKFPAALCENRYCTYVIFFGELRISNKGLVRPCKPRRLQERKHLGPVHIFQRLSERENS